MKASRIYVDTSVLGGCFDPEFAIWSNSLVEDFRRGIFMPVLSDVTAGEIERAPETVRALHEELAALGGEVITVSPEVLQVVAAYEAHAILGARYRNDLLHIALATVSAVDVLVSWNVRRIRDDMARELAGKSEAEIIAFYRRAGDAAREAAKRGGSVDPPSIKRMEPTRRQRCRRTAHASRWSRQV